MGRFEYRCAMRWGDMDAYAHVNNATWLVYLEQARVAMLFDRDDDALARGTVIARHEIDYLRPVVYSPRPLRLELWVEHVRGAAFTIRYEVFDGDALAARALTVCVPFDLAVGRPRRLTADEKDLLAAFADTAVARPRGASAPTAGSPLAPAPAAGSAGMPAVDPGQTP